MARVIRSNLQTTPKMVVKDAYDAFLRSRKNLCAISTFHIYDEVGRRVIIPALTYYSDDNIYSVTREILQTVIDDYAANHSTGGVSHLYRHLKAFVNWFWSEYEPITPNPITKIKVKRPSAPPKQGITSEEIDALLKAAKHHSTFPERDIAMIMILCDTGIRRSSFVNLKMADININRSEITVWEKDQQYHVKAFGVATTKAVKKYLQCLTDIKPEDPLWLSMDGTAITVSGHREILRRLCAEAGIVMHHYHDFRRYYALELYNSTHDIYMVSRALDHKDVAVTKRYIRTDEIEDKENARLYSPMDRRAGQTAVKVQR